MNWCEGINAVWMDVCIFICGIRDPTPLYISESDDDEINRLFH